MRYLTWIPRVVGFGLWFAWQLLRTNVQVIADNLTPGQASTPGIARCDTWCRTDAEVTLLGICIALTPGTLTVGTATRTDGLRVLYVHGMYESSADHLRASVGEMERRLLGAMRVSGHSTRSAPESADLARGGDA